MNLGPFSKIIINFLNQTQLGENLRLLFKWKIFLMQKKSEIKRLKEKLKMSNLEFKLDKKPKKMGLVFWSPLSELKTLLI